MAIHNIDTSCVKHRNTRNHNHDWVATLDSYDGAPDTTGIMSATGFGRTELLAVADLMESLNFWDEPELFINLTAIGMDGEMRPMDYWDEVQAEIKRRKVEAKECYMEDHR